MLRENPAVRALSLYLEPANDLTELGHRAKAACLCLAVVIAEEVYRLAL